jgi:two-component system, OmpR family, sensor kinase
VLLQAEAAPMAVRCETTRVLGRLWASRWPEAAWAAFAVGNLVWMVVKPSFAMLAFHLTWISLLLLYGLGYRTASRALTWWLLMPVIAGTVLIITDPHSSVPVDELIELPTMCVLMFAITRLTDKRTVAMAALDRVSRRNAELLELQRRFVQSASHELRTPITVALAHAELLPRSHDEYNEAAAASDAAIVVDELGRLRRLVDRLLLLATAESQDLGHPVPTRLRPLVDETLSRWSAVQRQWSVNGRDDVTVLADAERFVAALDAVLENAVRFTADGSPIELAVDRRGQEATVTVTDSGPGIPDDQLESVFDRFQGTSSLADGERNFGLGLSIVRAVAEAHGGRATAARGGSGGAAVTMWLPVLEPASAFQPAADAFPGH